MFHSISTKLVAAGVLAVSLLGISGKSCDAQDILRQPGALTPRLSPYLNYFRNDGLGVLDPYHAYVRPTMQIQRAYGSQQAQIRRLGSELEQDRGSVGGITGVGGSFMNYGHYYQGSTAPPRRSMQATTRPSRSSTMAKASRRAVRPR